MKVHWAKDEENRSTHHFGNDRVDLKAKIRPKYLRPGGSNTSHAKNAGQKGLVDQEGN